MWAVFLAIILDVKIENNGENISGGQKIRLEIARPLLRQKEVLLVDEATASLDPENAKKVHELILSLPLTIIKIAHHIDQKAHYDQIIEIKGCEATRSATSGEIFPRYQKES